MLYVLSLIILTAYAGPPCPGSDAWVHASCEIRATASATCADVADEFKSRVASQPMGWHDPHNNGTYTFDGMSGKQYSLHRRTGNNKYTDKMILTLTDMGSNACDIQGCSESQVTSVADFSTNYCNLRMLYCGSADGCKPVKHDITVAESSVKPSLGAGSSKDDCLQVM
eukprot:UN32522